MYRNLDAAKIVDTAAALSERIGERFPGSSLSRLASELLAVCREAAAMSEWLARPTRWLRVAVGAALLLLAGALYGALRNLHFQTAFASLSDLVQGLEAAVNDVVFVAIAVFFLLTWESRRKRKRALRALHVLRSMAHLVDMHQLTKDPARLISLGVDTRASPQRTMTPFELTRYLDYCSELLAVISKVAALYVQRFQDPVTLDAVDQVETLTAGLSRKIWQKIMILDRPRQ
ncbi:MAG TPA: hypothetical protein VGV61_19130 [Thermoanaerobaculia bacterium]|jgi:hypothetical protein|nr:hypothetical protein [Thermoanaerobaculia bacterium]